MSGFKYVIELIKEQMELMRDEIRFAEGEEIKELQERYKDCNEAHLALTGIVNGLYKQPEEALAINGVVKSFYCLNESVYGNSSKCVEQCLACALPKEQ